MEETTSDQAPFSLKCDVLRNRRTRQYGAKPEYATPQDLSILRIEVPAQECPGLTLDERFYLIFFFF